MATVEPDTIIDGRYRVRRRLGSGGMADVYLVEDQQLGRDVALKLLYHHLAEDHQFVAPMYVLSLAKAGQPGVKHDVDGTGFGWKTEALIAAKDNVPPMKCSMQRPDR